MKRLYITLTSDTGDRGGAVADIPTLKPRRADYDQFAILRGKKYEVHFYARGMGYTTQDTAALVNILINEPIQRAGLLERIVPLVTDAQFPLLLVVDEFANADITVVKAGFVGDTDYIEVYNTPARAPKASYPLVLIFDVYKAAGFVFREIPPEPTEGTPTSTAYVGIHESAGIEYEPVAAVFLEWLHGLERGN